MAAGGVEWGRGGQSLGTRMRREKGFQKLGRVRGRAVASLAFLTVLMIALLGCTAVDLRWVFGNFNFDIFFICGQTTLWQERK
jgi:hypothetical protein